MCKMKCFTRNRKVGVNIIVRFERLLSRCTKDVTSRGRVQAASVRGSLDRSEDLHRLTGNVLRQKAEAHV